MPEIIEKEVNRIPIKDDENQPKAEVVTVLKPLEVSDFLPKFEYALQGFSVSSEAKDLKAALVAFLEENKELITNGADPSNLVELDIFSKGFKSAIALIELWIDSMYITQ